MTSNPSISVLIATHNRRAALRRTLARLLDAATAPLSLEVIVVDNASSDGTAGQIASEFPDIRVISSKRNLGSCAKAIAIPLVRNPYTLFLDDDSAPRPGSLERMIEHFEADSRLAAAGFRVALPNGQEESGAFGDVFVGCGVGFRTEALRGVGGIDRGLFMQAEEYDLAFRLVAGGWRIRCFDDLWVDHEKTPVNRVSQRTLYYDARNNLLLTYRYLPDGWAEAFRTDWAQRYRWFAERSGAVDAFERATRFVDRIGVRQRERFASHRLSPSDLQSLIHIPIIDYEFAQMAKEGIKRVTFISLGKNILPFWLAAKKHGIQIAAIGDDRFAAPRRAYRGVGVVPVADALSIDADAVRVSDCSSARAAQILAEIRHRFDGSVESWFSRSTTADDPIAEPLLVGG